MTLAPAARSRERILVVVRGHLGDVMQAFPALRDLRRTRPEARITVLVNEYVTSALEQCPYVDHVIPGFAYRRLGRLAALARSARTLVSLAGRFDTVIALRWSPSLTPLLALVSGARVRVGYDRTGWAGRLLTHNLGPEPIDTVSNRVLNEGPLRSLGIATNPSYPLLDWTPEPLRRDVGRLLQKAGVLSSDRFALVQMSSHWGCGEWRSDKWVAVSEHLTTRHGLKVVATGTSDWFELAKLASVRGRCRTEVISLVGQTTLPQLFELVRRAEIVVAGDSGVAQVALAQRTPSVVLFGIEEIEANGPLPGEAGALMRTIQRWSPAGGGQVRNPHCAFGQSHCHGSFCTEDSSRRSIRAEDVIELVDQALRERVSA